MTNLCYIFAEQVKKYLGDFRPEIALILGSGLGKIAEQIENPIAVKYGDIEGFPHSTVSGHKGQLVAGMLGGKKVICMQGRVHLYEGYNPQIIAQIIRMFKLVGVKLLVVTNAAGSLTKEMPAGSIMLINDHINLSGYNPLIGENDDNIGPRFPAMGDAYSHNLRRLAKEAAADMKIRLDDGVYLMVSGPNFETAAEIRAFRTLGADAVGMSTVPEVIAAVHAGLQVVGFSIITNLGTGLHEEILTHDTTLKYADIAANKLSSVIVNLIERM